MAPTKVETAKSDNSRDVVTKSRNLGNKALGGAGQLFPPDKIEAEVFLDPATGQQVVTSLRYRDPLTNETLEVATEPRPEEEARQELQQAVASVRQEQESQRPERGSKAR